MLLFVRMNVVCFYSKIAKMKALTVNAGASLTCVAVDTPVQIWPRDQPLKLIK